MHKEEEVELDPQVRTVPMDGPSLFLVETVTPLQFLPNDHQQYQELLQSVANDLQIALEEVKDLQHWHLDIVQPQGPSKVALLINEAILKLPRAV